MGILGNGRTHFPWGSRRLSQGAALYTTKFDEGFIKRYNEKSEEWYFVEYQGKYQEEFHKLHNYLPFLSEKMKIEKVEKLVADLHDKNECVIHLRNLKQVLNHGLYWKKIHWVIKFNQRTWLKSYIEMDTAKKKARNDFEKEFLKNNSVFWKTMKNVRKHRDIKFVTTEKRKAIWCQNQIIIAQSFSQKTFLQ